LRGSHLIFPAWRLPVAQAVGFLHPADRRPVFVFPWEGITLVGTTDLDHEQPLDEEPAISAEEVDYLLEAVRAEFPGLGLEARDVMATFAGVRPVVGSERVDPSRESRDHVIWEEAGLLTVTGGKLTTFRLIALDALEAVRSRLPGLQVPGRRTPVLNPVHLPKPEGVRLEEAQWQRLIGRYSSDAPEVVAAAQAEELVPLPGLQTLWAELRWAARAEAVEHLDDLLLRRVRLGLLLPEGGRQLLPAIRDIVLPELGWDEARWEAEVSAYLSLWRRAYYLPNRLVQPGAGV
ncbi:MAG: FAD-dependent oxidoreductase, partial [Anaerolineae bacterium]|nr:FAD-dependent oxidoreductase [Anaerolineae bacterium]